MPSWWTAREHEPARDRRDAVDRAICFAWRLRERELRARQEEVVDEVVAGLAELREVGDRRLVGLDKVATAAAAAAARSRRPVSCCGASVTVRSVPMPASGFSVFLLRAGRDRARGSRSRRRARRRPRGRASVRTCAFGAARARCADSGRRTRAKPTRVPSEFPKSHPRMSCSLATSRRSAADVRVARRRNRVGRVRAGAERHLAQQPREREREDEMPAANRKTGCSAAANASANAAWTAGGS